MNAELRTLNAEYWMNKSLYVMIRLIHGAHHSLLASAIVFVHLETYEAKDGKLLAEKPFSTFNFIRSNTILIKELFQTLQYI